MQHPIGIVLGLALMGAAFTMPMAGAAAADLTVTMRRATQDGTGETLGTIAIEVDAATGARFKLDLHGLPPGPHGFHVHENGNCDPILLNGVRIPAGAAGGHLDPDRTGKHEGPAGEGHLGDLPVLVTAADGKATQTLVAPRIKSVDALKGRALIVHIGGDNYSDAPGPLGGGGGRFACGLVE